MMIKHILMLTFITITLLGIPTLQHAYSAKPIIIFDKPAYNPFATAKILIVDPTSNIDNSLVDTVRAVVYTKSNVGNLFEFTEVAPDAGVFQAFVRLTPNNNEWPADITVQKNDGLIVEYNSKEGSSTGNVKIDFSDRKSVV